MVSFGDVPLNRALVERDRTANHRVDDLAAWVRRRDTKIATVIDAPRGVLFRLDRAGTGSSVNRAWARHTGVRTDESGAWHGASVR